MERYFISFCFVMTFLFHCHPAMSQGLHTGDKFPEIELNVTNYYKDKIKISELKGKLIILDFWSHICINCLKAFPEIDSLQNEFKGKVQFILVNAESAEFTKAFFSERKHIRPPNVPFIMGDSILLNLFPHSGVPYHVWIDPSGIIRYKTEGYNTTKATIGKFLEGLPVNLHNFSKINFLPSLFDTTYIKSLEYFSYLSHCIANTRLGSISGAGYDQLIFSCTSAVDLYKRAFEEGGQYGFSAPGRIVLELKDSFKYVFPKDSHLAEEWKRKYCYNYHLFIPKKKSNEKYRIMQKDLNRFFNLTASVQKQTVNCLALVRTTKSDRMNSNGGKPLNTFYATSLRSKRFDSVRAFINQPYSSFSERFRHYIENSFKIPFVDLTGFSKDKMIDMRFRGTAIDSNNLIEIKAQLEKYDLDIVEIPYPITVLIIKDGTM